MTNLAQLEAARHCYGPGCAARVEKLLKSLKQYRGRSAETLIRLHDALLFLRAFPQSRKVADLADALLARIPQEVSRLRESGADMDPFEPERVSGIAGTRITDTFTYEVAQWLYSRYSNRLSAEWDIEEQARRMGATLPRFIPLLDDDALVEADTPFLKWLSSAAGDCDGPMAGADGKDKKLAWLLQVFEKLPGRPSRETRIEKRETPFATPAEKTELYDALGLLLRWDLGTTPASRTFAQRGVEEIFSHHQPLIRRAEVSLAEELKSQPLDVRELSSAEGHEVLDLVRAAVTVRYRELYGTTRGDPEHVYEARPGRGVQIFLWGLPPERRLPLRAYHAGMTLKNGIPINYVEGISLCEWMEVGFNTFYAYRDGETAWIYAKVIHLLHQLTGVTCISIYPYQLGHDNEEAIDSGAFWFYRKLGFRPGKPELLALAQREEEKIGRNPKHRTSARTLRKLAAGHMFYEFGAEQGLWDNFSTRNIGFAVNRCMAAATAKDFHGDMERMRQASTASLARGLAVDLKLWTPAEQQAFSNFAMVLSLVPVKQWSSGDRKELIEMIRAKVAPEEIGYLRRLQQHATLKSELVRLGSGQST